MYSKTPTNITLVVSQDLYMAPSVNPSLLPVAFTTPSSLSPSLHLYSTTAHTVTARHAMELPDYDSRQRKLKKEGMIYNPAQYTYSNLEI